MHARAKSFVLLLQIKLRLTGLDWILLNGALQWPRTEEEQELAQQHMAEFTRIAEMLTDTDVLVLRAIYDARSPLILRYNVVTLGFFVRWVDHCRISRCLKAEVPLDKDLRQLPRSGLK